jgi:hypothetical protein
MKVITGDLSGFYAVLTWHVLRDLRKWKELKGEKVGVFLPQRFNLYWDQIKGPNVWEYYYQQIDLIEGNIEYLYAKDMPQVLDLYPGMNIRQTLHEIYTKYIHYNEITKKILNKTLSYFNDYNSILGLHIRKTDRYTESDKRLWPVDDKKVFTVIDKALSENSYNKIYLATDDADMYSLYIKRYGNLIIPTTRIRGSGNISIHHHMKEQSGYIKGLEAILDMEALARCKFLVKGTSNLSQTSMIVNINLECYNTNKIFNNDPREEESMNIYSKPYIK